MDRFDRIFALHQLFINSHQPVSRQKIEQVLECSRATAKRIIENMRDYLNAPIEYNRSRNGYYYDSNSQYGKMYELPGVWFNASELLALLSVQQLLSDVQPGLLERQLAPLKDRIDQLLSAQHTGGEEISQRIRILRAAARPSGAFFQTVASALSQRRRLQIEYFKRNDAQTSERHISPQRMVHYRDNWYLDAWCHLRNGLRTFALDAIRSAIITEKKATDIPGEQLDKYFYSAYGIFSGSADKLAVLRFLPQRARWVAQEQWHPKQQSCWLEDGRYELRLPYYQPHELIMDILKYGPDVEVAGPESLRAAVRRRLEEATAVYQYDGYPIADTNPKDE